MPKDLEEGGSSSSSHSHKKNGTSSAMNTFLTFYHSRWGKLVFCFAGLQASYLVWGVVQEQLMTTEYSFGKFKSSTFCVFANRFLALIISLIIVVVRKYTNDNQGNGTVSEGNSSKGEGNSEKGSGDSAKSGPKDVPFYYYAPSSLSNTISSWAQYEALKYISFPTQVLSKSCKIIPVMIVSTSLASY